MLRSFPSFDTSRADGQGWRWRTFHSNTGKFSLQKHTAESIPTSQRKNEAVSIVQYAEQCAF